MRTDHTTARVGPQRPRWVAAAIVAIGGCVLIYFWHAARPLWVDEEMLALNIRDRSFAELPGPLWLGQAAPLGWLALERASMLTVGVSERAIRVLPVLWGLLTLGVVVVAGHRRLGAVGATVLALLASCGTYLWHFTLEFKQYSADTFGGLALPVLAAWASPRDDVRQATRRADVWWISAGLLQWTSFGALFIAPGCGAALVALMWRRAGPRAALRTAAWSLFWAACVGLHYYASIRHASGSAYLRDYWAAGFPPLGAGWAETFHWCLARLESLAENPGATRHAILFWTVSIAGLAVAMRHGSSLAFMLATAVPAAVVLALLRLVPLSDRLSLWVLPALYVGIAFAADSTVHVISSALARKRWATAALGVACALLVASLCVDIARTGLEDLRDRSPSTAHGLDDRAAVRMLVSARRPGDAMIVTRLGLPAVWWYAGLDASDATNSGSFPDGGPIFEISQDPETCQPAQFADALRGLSGATLYLGFELGTHFEDLALSRLSELGTISRYQRFASFGHTAVIDFGHPQGRFVRPGADSPDPSVRPDGCIGITRARRW